MWNIPAIGRMCLRGRVKIFEKSLSPQRHRVTESSRGIIWLFLRSLCDLVSKLRPEVLEACGKRGRPLLHRNSSRGRAELRWSGLGWAAARIGGGKIRIERRKEDAIGAAHLVPVV